MNFSQHRAALTNHLTVGTHRAHSHASGISAFCGYLPGKASLGSLKVNTQKTREKPQQHRKPLISPMLAATFMWPLTSHWHFP